VKDKGGRRKMEKQELREVEKSLSGFLSSHFWQEHPRKHQTEGLGSTPNIAARARASFPRAEDMSLVPP
jgi:hypothetical protein